MKVNLISVTPNAEATIAYCARVSSTKQDNPEYSKLIAYLIKHKHWSPLEMANMCVEIETTRAISPQILRHRSFSFQEFSQRYSEAMDYEVSEPRLQDTKNKQNSIIDNSGINDIWFKGVQDITWQQSYRFYKEALERGIAKEVARNLLPLNTKTKLYMNGSLRSWVHYLEVRTDKSTQLEHREIAEAIKAIFIEQFPNISKALDWIKDPV